jgi:hypothetical protein
MIRHRIIRASELRPGLATIVASLPGRTIRSRAVMVEHHGHGTVQVAFECGEIVSFAGRSALGYIEPEKTTRRGPPGRKAAS